MRTMFMKTFKLKQYFTQNISLKNVNKSIALLYEIRFQVEISNFATKKFIH
jgi:hypothetical protein